MTEVKDIVDIALNKLKNLKSELADKIETLKILRNKVSFRNDNDFSFYSNENKKKSPNDNRQAINVSINFVSNLLNKSNII